MKSLLCVGLTLLFSLASIARAQPEITAVELRSDTPLPPTFDFEAAIAIEPGKPLERQQVTRTLENLWASNLIDDAQVLVRDQDAVAVVVVRLKPRIDVIRVVSTTAEGALRRSVAHPVGAPLDRDLVEMSRAAMLAVLRSRGYVEADVETKMVTANERENSLVFAIEPGPRFAVEQVEIRGHLPVEIENKARQLFARRRGKPYRPERAGEDRETLESWLADSGYLAAQVMAATETLDSSTSTVNLRYEIDLGPRIEIEISGAELRALRPAPFLQGGRYDLALVAESCERLRERLQRKGFHRPRVTFREQPSETGKKLLIEVDRGPVARIESIEFTGNTSFSRNRLLQFIATDERRAMRPSSGRLVDRELAEDIANLQSFYRLAGFSDAQVGPATLTEIAKRSNEPTRLEVEIPIVEGPQRRVVQLDISIDEQRPDRAMTRLIAPHLRPGGPFHPALVEDSIRTLRAHFEQQGFWSLDFETQLDWSADGKLVDIHLVITRGQRTVLDGLVFRGLRDSRPRALGSLISLKKGESFSRSDLLVAEQELYQLGIFRRVDVETSTARHRDHAHDSSAERQVDVVIDLEERRPWRFGYGLSYHTDDGLGGVFDISRFNLRGIGDRLQLQARGNASDRRFRFTYDQPLSFGRRLPISYSIYRLDQNRDSFDVQSLGARITLRRQLGRSRFALVLDHRLVDLSEETIDPADIERADREIDITTITPQLFIDRRDNPLDPTTGWSSTVQLQWAVPWFAATEFLKLFGQHTWHRQLGKAGTLALSGRIGALEPLDPDAPSDPLVPADLSNSLVPISERFFAGGRTSHRAYERDALGILDQTLFRVGDDIVESGGNGLAIVNMDYRFPIAGSVGGTLFFDLGNVWADWRDIDASQLEAGAGIGLRYRSPIGPLRLELGWKLDRQPGEDDPVLFVSFGHAF